MLAEGAQKWANHLAAIDQMQHDDSTKLGENIFYMYGGNPHEACQRAVRSWYEEGKTYDFNSKATDTANTSEFTITAEIKSVASIYQYSFLLRFLKLRLPA